MLCFLWFFFWILGYINWRQFKPKGARGETSDVFTGRAEQKLLPDLKLLPSGFQLPQQAVATGDAELQRTGIGSATSFRALPTLDEPQPSDDVQFDVAGPRRKSSVGTVIPRPLKDPLIQPFSLVSELRVGAPPVGSSVGLVGLAEDLGIVLNLETFVRRNRHLKVVCCIRSTL